MRYKKGFTLLECIITLCIYTIVLSLAMGLYLAGYKFYRLAEEQTDAAENIRIALDRISQNIRLTDSPCSKITISENSLSFGDYKYNLSNGILYESIKGVKNQLSLNINSFQPVMENKMLKVTICGKNPDDTDMVMEMAMFLGGEL